VLAPESVSTLDKSRYIALPFYTSALVRGEWSATRFGRFIPLELAPETIVSEDGLAPEPVWTLRSRGYICSYTIVDPGTRSR
jgi:hypothetical protein